MDFDLDEYLEPMEWGGSLCLLVFLGVAIALFIFWWRNDQLPMD